MEILLVVIAILFFLAGFIGCIVPLVPGPPLAFAGLLFLHFTRFTDFSTTLLLVMATITVLVTVADFYLPLWFTKKYGGSRAATVGAGVGVVAGVFFFPPLGIIVCPFIGAFVGELLHDNRDHNKAFRVALGSLAAFMAGTGIKLITCGVITYYGIAALI